MRDTLRASLVVGAALLSTVVGAQIQPIPQQQLESGFLSDRNAQLTSQDAPPNDSYTQQATAAINLQDYKRALAILRPYRLSHDPAYHYLAGRAYEGLGDYAAARRELSGAIRVRKTFIGAHLALGLMEAEHGDKMAASRILEDLKTQQAKCAGRCRESTNLSVAVDMIESALRARPD